MSTCQFVRLIIFFITFFLFRSLYDNKIRCVQPGSFDRMKHLTTLNLLANPLNCNCHMKWLSQWLKHHDVVTGNPKCQSPDQLKDVPIEDVQLNDFRCDQQDDQSECEGDSLCPSKCTCTGTQVRCSRQKLSKFPTNIQPITTELYLGMFNVCLCVFKMLIHVKEVISSYFWLKSQRVYIYNVHISELCHIKKISSSQRLVYVKKFIHFKGLFQLNISSSQS